MKLVRFSEFQVFTHRHTHRNPGTRVLGGFFMMTWRFNMTTTSITGQLVPEEQRLGITENLFGVHFPLQLEPLVFMMTERLSPDYGGGYWQFYSLSNGGFYMAPDIDSPVAVYADNGFGGMMSADSLGVTACLYAYSHLSFSEDEFAQVCAQQYHLLREYMFALSESEAILAAID